MTDFNKCLLVGLRDAKACLRNACACFVAMSLPAQSSAVHAKSNLRSFSNPVNPLPIKGGWNTRMTANDVLHILRSHRALPASEAILKRKHPGAETG